MSSKAIGHIYQVGIKYIENIKFVWYFKSNKKFLFLLLLIDPVLYVFNKIDAYRYPEDAEQPFDKDVFWGNFQKTYASHAKAVLFISAKDHTNITPFRETITTIVKERYKAIYPNYLY